MLNQTNFGFYSISQNETSLKYSDGLFEYDYIDSSAANGLVLSVEPNLKAEFNIFNFYRFSDDTAKFVRDLTVGSIIDAGFEVDLGMVTMPTKVIDGEPINITHVRERWSGGQSYYEQGNKQHLL